MEPKRIMIVDDEPHLKESLLFNLKQEGYTASGWDNGKSALDELNSFNPHLAVLDIMMPGMSGLELCRKIREINPALPIIFLSSKDQELDRILGLEIGADDYLCKPFSLRELNARIRALLRRSDLLANSVKSDENKQQLSIGRLFLNTDALIAGIDEKGAQLSVTEFKILEALANRPDTVKTREQLILSGYSQEIYLNDRAIDCHIKRIRKKLNEVASDFDAIETVYGAGYRLNSQKAAIKACQKSLS